MKISGIVVGVAPGHFDDVVAALERLDGVDVHQRHEASARLVVTQEAATEIDQERGLERIQALPHVRYAQLVYHLADADIDADAGEAGEQEEEQP